MAVGASSLYTIVGMYGVCVMVIRRMAGDLEFIWKSHEFAAGDLDFTRKCNVILCSVAIGQNFVPKS